MKRTVIAMWLLLMPLFLLAQPDPIEDYVRVELNDGQIIEGYITRYWSQNGLFRQMNRDFKMSLTPDGADEKTYTAEEVKRVSFIHPTLDNDTLKNLSAGVVSADVNNPSTFHPRRIIRQFVHLEGTTQRGEIYWWNGIDRQQLQLGGATISTIFGVRLADDETIVPFMTGNVISLNALRIVYKKKNPQLVNYLDQRILKGGGKLWKEISRNPMRFMELVDEYFEQEEISEEGNAKKEALKKK